MITGLVLTCLVLLMLPVVLVAHKFPSFLEVVMRGGDVITSGVTRQYHQGNCAIKFPRNGNFRTYVSNEEDARWHIPFQPNTKSFCSRNDQYDDVFYKLQRDGNFYVNCRGDFDYITHSHQNKTGDYVMAIDDDCMLYIFEGIIDKNGKRNLQKEIWASDLFEPLGPDDRLRKGQILHDPSYMVVNPDSGNLEVRKQESDGSLKVLYSADQEWKKPLSSKFHDFYAKVSPNDGHLKLVGIDYEDNFTQTVYFSKNLGAKGLDCFTLGTEPIDADDDVVDLVAIPCEEE